MGALVLLLVCVARVRAEVPDDAEAERAVVPPVVASPEERLARATDAYLQGDAARARALLQTLLADGPSLPALVRREALAYLGDILYSEQGAEASRSVFESLLRESPDYRMDPYVHPAPVCAWVETVRADVRSRVAPGAAVVVAGPVDARAAPTPAFPVEALLPGGVHLFRAGRPRAGSALAALQLGGFVLSAVTRARIDDAFASREDDPDAVARLVWVNRGAAAVAWVAWGVPAAVEIVRWSGGRRAAAVRVEAGAMRVEGTF